VAQKFSLHLTRRRVRFRRPGARPTHQNARNGALRGREQEASWNQSPVGRDVSGGLRYSAAIS